MPAFSEKAQIHTEGSAGRGPPQSGGAGRAAERGRGAAESCGDRACGDGSGGAGSAALLKWCEAAEGLLALCKPLRNTRNVF